MPSPIVVLLDAWPQPSSAPEALVFATETQLLLRYYISQEEAALIQFPLVKTFQFGSPNDEALGGHPLSKLGLKFYTVHQIENSPWIAELERRNAVHPSYNKERFLEDTIHYVFTFQDSTLECVVKEGQYWKPVIKLLPNEEAKAEWTRIITDLTQ